MSLIAPMPATALRGTGPIAFATACALSCASPSTFGLKEPGAVYVCVVKLYSDFSLRSSRFSNESQPVERPGVVTDYLVCDRSAQALVLRHSAKGQQFRCAIGVPVISAHHQIVFSGM